MKSLQDRMGDAWEQENAAFQPGAKELSREKADVKDFIARLTQWLKQQR